MSALITKHLQCHLNGNKNMTPIKYSINFFLDKKEGSETAPLRFRIAWSGGQRLSMNVGYSIDINGWSQQEQRCKKKSLHGKKQIPAQVINRTIEKITSIIDDAFAQFSNSPSKEELKNIIDPSDKKNDKTKLITSYFNEFLNDGELDGWSESTCEKLLTLKHHFKGYNPNLTFDDIDENFSRSFTQYLLSKNIGNVTIKKYLKNVQWFVRWAKDKGYCNCDDFLSHKDKLKTAKRPIIFLSWSELMTLYNFDFKQRYALEQVRDVFCFSCFTSLRFSDVQALKRSNVNETHISITTKKTSASLIIDLNKYSKAILDKYKDIDFPNGGVLPVISGPRTNEHLKEIAKMCGFDDEISMTAYYGNKREDTKYKKWELITFHSARRTFISNALMLGIPANIVMKWTGHTDYKAMLPYIEIADEARKSAMGLFDK